MMNNDDKLNIDIENIINTNDIIIYRYIIYLYI